jgi:ATP-dependent DNA helicase RecG
MLTADQLKALMTDLESDSVERTLSTTKTDKFGEAICAFANDFPNHRRPGYLLIGVDDQGKAAGLAVTDELLRDLASLRSNVNLEPLPAMTVQKYVTTSGDVAVVEVLPADLPPVRYKGRVWIRVGPSRRAANQQEERMLTEKRTAFQKTFDARPCTGCRLDDLALGLFTVTYLPSAVARDVIEENNRSQKEQMASLRFFDLAADCPTNAGALMFGKDPLQWIPGASVQFVRWAGTSVADSPVNERRFMK